MEDQVEALHAKAAEKFGGIDYAVNVAGYGPPPKKTATMSSEELALSYATNQRGTFLCERAQLRQMLKQDIPEGFSCRGSIVNITSLCATCAIPNTTAYSSHKVGILTLSKTDAIDYGPEMIRVNCVAPGDTATPMLLGCWQAEHVKASIDRNPLRRIEQPEDIENAVVWLSSPMAGWITGISIPVDGGQSLFSG